MLARNVHEMSQTVKGERKGVGGDEEMHTTRRVRNATADIQRMIREQKERKTPEVPRHGLGMSNETRTGRGWWCQGGACCGSGR